MPAPRTPRAWWKRVGFSALVWAVLGLIAWLDSDGCALALRPAVPIVAANVFSAIWTGLQVLAGWVATAAEVTATYVWIALQWLSASVASFLRATGSMFAKVWDGVKIVWRDVLKPALQWVDAHLKRLYAWMRTTFRPVFDFLRDVRARFNKFYTTFVRPVVDTLDFIRAINRALLAFHITVLQSLDSVIQQLERRIQEPFLWINKQLNTIQNVLDRIVTANGYLQRLTTLRSMDRYAPTWIRMFWVKQVGPGAGLDHPYVLDGEYPARESAEDIADLRAFLVDGSGPRAAEIAELAANAMLVARGDIAA
jgi:hypothetical protein